MAIRRSTASFARDRRELRRRSASVSCCALGSACSARATVATRCPPSRWTPSRCPSATTASSSAWTPRASPPSSASTGRRRTTWCSSAACGRRRSSRCARRQRARGWRWRPGGRRPGRRLVQAVGGGPERMAVYDVGRVPPQGASAGTPGAGGAGLRYAPAARARGVRALAVGADAAAVSQSGGPTAHAPGAARRRAAGLAGRGRRNWAGHGTAPRDVEALPTLADGVTLWCTDRTGST